jgi:thiosulfate dehydrogenase
MKIQPKNLGLALGIAAASVGLLVAVTGWAKAPPSDAKLADEQKELLAMVDRGRDLWHGGIPSGNGLACGNCHPDAAAANPQTFPKFVTQLNQVAPFRDMVNWCIVHPMDGKELDVKSADMVALEAYAVYLHRGEPLEPGLETRQTVPIAVKSGVGYPKTPSGLGVDK